MKIADKLFLNTTFLMSSSIITIILSLVYWLIIGKFLPPHDYGIISTTVNFSAFLAIISLFGFNLTITKLLPEYLERGENDKVSSLLKFSLKFILISSFIIGLILTMFSPIIANLLNLPRTAILIGGALVIFITIGGFIDATLRGYQNMKWIPLIDICGNTVKIIISAILILLGFRYIGPLFGFLSLYIITAIIGAKIIHFPRNNGEINEKQIILKYSIPEFFSRIVFYVFYSGRFIILNIIKGPAVTGIFNLATVLTTPVTLFPNALLETIFPLASQLLAKKNTRHILTKIIKHFIRYTLLVTLPLSLFLIIFSKPIILFFSKATYLDSSNLFPIIVAASIIFSLGNIFHRTLYVLNKTVLYRNIMIFSVTIFLISSFILTFKFSAIGMSYAFLVFSLCFSTFSFFQIRKFIKISLPLLSVSKIFVSSGISMYFLYLLSNISNGLLSNIILTFVSGFLYISILILLRFIESDDMKLIQAIVNKLPFLKPIQNLLMFLSFQK